MKETKTVSKEIIVGHEDGFIRTKLPDGKTFVDHFKWELGFGDIDLDYKEDGISITKVYEKDGPSK